MKIKILLLKMIVDSLLVLVIEEVQEDSKEEHYLDKIHLWMIFQMKRKSLCFYIP
jgi:hypothetical protein